MPHLLYSFFTGFSDFGAPSFSKFARSVGATIEDLQHWRRHKEFDRAYRECSEIRRDYLIDCALCRRCDASLTKFLLSTEFGMDNEDKSVGELLVRVEVVE